MKTKGYCICGNFCPHVVNLKKGICLECKGKLRPKIIKKDTSQIDADLRRLILSMRSRLKHKTPEQRKEIVETILA